MKKKDDKLKRKKLQDFISKKVEEYSKKLLLDTYEIELKTADLDVLANCTTTHPYTNVTLRFDITKLLEYDLKYVEQTVIHELLHIHLSRFQVVAQNRFTSEKEITDVHENLTDIFTKIIYNK
jgi:predicted metal-dependent hydrolase